jgi:hypothetical protein
MYFHAGWRASPISSFNKGYIGSYACEPWNAFFTYFLIWIELKMAL